MPVPFAPRLRVALLNALGIVAPATAARRVADIFTTPRQFEVPAWERELALQGRPRRVAGLNVTEFGAKVGPPIILLHGWEGRGLQLGHFVAALRGLGARVIAVDGPAHGGSLGVTSGPFEFAKALLDLQSTFGPFRGIVAHSMGGPAAAIAMARGLKVERLALLGSPADLGAVLDRFCDYLGLSARVRSAFRDEMGARTGVSVAESAISYWVGARTLPVLVVHDRQDAEVPLADGHACAAAFRHAEVVEVDVGGHRRMLKAPEVVALVATFFGSRAARDYTRTRAEYATPGSGTAVSDTVRSRGAPRPLVD